MAIAALILPLLFIIYEDFSYRAIHWFWLLLLTIIALWAFPWTSQHLWINGLLVAFQMAALTLYFSIKEGQFVQIINRYLGIGDLLFFIPLGILLSPGNFICFFILSLMLSLGGHLVSYSLNPHKTITIPLAGYMSLTLIAVVLSSVFLDFNLQDDYWIKNLILRIRPL